MSYTTRIMTSAFLFSESDILLILRSADRTLHPNRWTGVGGHIEPQEINNPTASCFREVLEETGIQKNEIEDFNLRYIILRQRNTEIRQQYVFFGRSKTRRLGNTNEGVLHWVAQSDLFSLDLVPTTRLLLEHYFSSASMRYRKVISWDTGAKPTITSQRHTGCS